MSAPLWWSTGSGRIELHFTRADVGAVAQPGSNDAAVAALRKRFYVVAQLASVTDAVLAEELREWGAWTEEELSDRESNLDRLVWLACWGINEGDAR